MSKKVRSLSAIFCTLGAGPSPGIDTAWRADLDSWGPWLPCSSPAPELGDCWQSAREVSQPLVVVHKCTSSLDVLKGLSTVFPVWGSVLAINQTAGRGQLRRGWSSLPGNILAAVNWPAMDPGLEPLLPLLIGLGLVKAFAALGLELELKWPNDILLGGKKVAGTLIEEHDGSLLVGIGINLRRSPGAEELRRPWGHPATSLASTGLEAGPLSLWCKLVQHLKSWYKLHLCLQTPDILIAQCREYLVGWGQTALVQPADGPVFEGQIVGIGRDGALLVQTANGLHRLYNGSYVLAKG